MRYLLLLILLIPISGYSQRVFNSLLVHEKLMCEKTCLNAGESYFSLMQPSLENSVQFRCDSSILRPERGASFIAKLRHPFFYKKLRTESLIQIDTGKMNLYIDPVLDFQYAKENGKVLSVNTRGVNIRGKIAGNLTFETTVLENQAFFPDYVTQYIKIHRVVPGQGRARNFKEGGYDFAHSSGKLRFNPLSWLQIELGHGKLFIGDGYRSLLISDFASAYPYLRSTLTTKKLQYNWVLTSFQETTSYDSRITAFHRKNGSFITLEYLLHKNISIGFFEGIIWQTTDSTTNNLIPASYFLPLPGIRLAFLGMNNSHNAVIGWNMRINLLRQIQIYGQWMLDHGSKLPDSLGGKNLSGFQAGIKLLEPLKIKGLYLRAEYNSINPYCYTHTTARQHYSVFNEPLTHPLGANFKEVYAYFRYQISDFFLEGSLSQATKGLRSDSTDAGSYFFTSTDQALSAGGQSFPNGFPVEITNMSITAGMIINTANHLEVAAGIQQRTATFEGSQAKTSFFFVALRTRILNRYYDF